MSLTPMKQMLIKARHDGNAVGAFEFWSYDSARAVIEAAEARRVPVILQVGHFERDYMGGYPNAYRIASMAAEHASVPVALHLDHADSYGEVLLALEAGFTSVMIDASARSFEDNIYITSQVVRLAAQYGATVEAELGQLLGNEGNVVSANALTDPDSAAEFVARTGVDALAVAIGTAHGFYKETPHIDIDRLKQIAAKVAIPLVLHGGSGTPDEAVRQAIKCGISKVNICTEFICAMGREMQRVQQAGITYNVMTLFNAGKEAGKKLASEKIELFTPNIGR